MPLPEKQEACMYMYMYIRELTKYYGVNSLQLPGVHSICVTYKKQPEPESLRGEDLVDPSL